MPLLIRDADPGDERSVARIHVAAWRAGYRGLLPDAFLDAMRPEDRARRYTFADRDPARPHTLLAVDGSAALGFATTMPTGDADVAGAGELAALHVDPDHWRRGIGGALIAAARARLIEQGFALGVVWVLQGNERARHFYEADGWRGDDAARDDIVWGAAVREFRMRRALR